MLQTVLGYVIVFEVGVIVGIGWAMLRVQRFTRKGK